MQQTDGPNRIYKCAPGEQVTITLVPENDPLFGSRYFCPDISPNTGTVTGNTLSFKMPANDTSVWLTFFFHTPTAECAVYLSDNSGNRYQDSNGYENIDYSPMSFPWIFTL